MTRFEIMNEMFVDAELVRVADYEIIFLVGVISLFKSKVTIVTLVGCPFERQRCLVKCFRSCGEGSPTEPEMAASVELPEVDFVGYGIEEFEELVDLLPEVDIGDRSFKRRTLVGVDQLLLMRPTF